MYNGSRLMHDGRKALSVGRKVAPDRQSTMYVGRKRLLRKRKGFGWKQHGLNKRLSSVLSQYLAENS